MSSSDRPSDPNPGITPADGFFRPGLIYIDDSVTALQTVRRALYPYTLLLDTFTSLAEFRESGASRVVGALLDVDLADGASGLDAAHAIVAEFAGARIAFITAEASPERTAVLERVGPVFVKGSGLASAVAWLVAVSREEREAHVAKTESG